MILASARKHGISDNDVLYAYRNPVRVFDLHDLAMMIGADKSGRLLEIDLVAGEGVDSVVHATEARPRFLRRR